MDNLFYNNNFRLTTPVCRRRDNYQSFSDTLYNAGKGVNFYYLNIGTDANPVYRTVSDVELAYSTDPSIQSIISPLMQQNLRLSLSSMKHSDTSSELVMPQSLELDERIEYGKVLISKHADFSKSHVDDVSPAPSTPTSGEVPPTDGSATTKE